MYNNGRRRHDKKLSKKRKYTYRHVVAYELKENLEDEVRMLSGSVPGTSEYFAKYQPALRNICEGLTDERKKRYEKIAKDWNEEMPPKEIQRV